MQVSVDRGGCEGKMATFVRPGLEECEEPVVGSSCRYTDTNGRVEVCVGKNIINIISSSDVQCKSSRGTGKGDDLMDQMEFEGGGKADAAY